MPRVREADVTQAAVVAQHLRQTLDLAMLAQEREARLTEAVHEVIDRHRGCQRWSSPMDCVTGGEDVLCDACLLREAFHA